MAEPAQAVFLFVGGPLDGERRRVELREDGSPVSCIRVHVLADSGRLLGPNDPWATLTTRLFEYRLVFVTDAGRPGVGLYVGEDVADPFARLLAGYKPEKAGG